jgi:hypothetical protein
MSSPAVLLIGEVVGLALGKPQEIRFESRMGL